MDGVLGCTMIIEWSGWAGSRNATILLELLDSHTDGQSNVSRFLDFGKDRV